MENTPMVGGGDRRTADRPIRRDAATTGDAVQIASGAKVWFERWGGTETIEGRVRLVEPSAFTKISALGIEEQRVNVVIDVLSPQEQWRSVGDGYHVDARIVIFHADDVVQVPIGTPVS